jgi:signal transduction histidine kinase
MSGEPPTLPCSHLAYVNREVASPDLELERDRIVAQLAGAVAHQLKQPLAVAWGYLELLLDDPDLDLAPSTLHYLHEIRESLHSMDEFINLLQRARTYQTRPYAGGREILDLE